MATIAEQLTSLNTNLNTINTEVGNQAGLIAQIKAKVESLPDAGSGDSGDSSESYDEGYNAGYADGEAVALEGYIDWNMATTSNSCYVYFCNNHPSYNVYIAFEVYERASGEDYYDEVTIAANGQFEWSHDEMGVQGFSGGEWELVVTEMRFIKDET